MDEGFVKAILVMILSPWIKQEVNSDLCFLVGLLVPFVFCLFI